jgi:ATP synthase F1 delta subunit
MNYASVSRNIACKYARAFLAVFPKACTLSNLHSIKTAHHFLRHHKNALFFLNLPQFNDERKKSLIADLVAYCSLPDAFTNLFFLLINHNRPFYVPEVLACIIEQYKKQTNSVEFSLESSHSLHGDDIETMKHFLQKILQKNIIATSSVNTSLIAGIRLHSNEYVWEYSVRKQINALHILNKKKVYCHEKY